MIEIIALILLTGQMGRLASHKGLKPGRWQLYTVLAWVAGEIVGFIIGLLMFEINNYVSIMLMGLAGAVTGYFAIKANLSKRPDALGDDINQ